MKMNTKRQSQGKRKTSREQNRRDVWKFINMNGSISPQTKDDSHIILSSQIKNNQKVMNQSQETVGKRAKQK